MDNLQDLRADKFRLQAMKDKYHMTEDEAAVIDRAIATMEAVKELQLFLGRRIILADYAQDDNFYKKVACDVRIEAFRSVKDYIKELIDEKLPETKPDPDKADDQIIYDDLVEYGGY